MRIDVSRAGGRILDTKFLERRDRFATIGVMYRCVIYGPAQRFRVAWVRLFPQTPVAAKSGKKVAGLQGERFGKCRVGFVAAGNFLPRGPLPWFVHCELRRATGATAQLLRPIANTTQLAGGQGFVREVARRVAREKTQKVAQQGR
jgi:hypothetical protein